VTICGVLGVTNSNNPIGSVLYFRSSGRGERDSISRSILVIVLRPPVQAQMMKVGQKLRVGSSHGHGHPLKSKNRVAAGLRLLQSKELLEGIFSFL